ncbi:Tyrosine-protein phosphatase non-receptor type 23, partial [Stegodyphus mimosarum]
MSVKPSAISELTESMNELLRISKEVDEALKQSSAILAEEEEKELKYQETFGKRGPSMIIVELKKECSKYEEAHKRAVESN